MGLELGQRGEQNFVETRGWIFIAHRAAFQQKKTKKNTTFLGSKGFYNEWVCLYKWQQALESNSERASGEWFQGKPTYAQNGAKKEVKQHNFGDISFQFQKSI